MAKNGLKMVDIFWGASHMINNNIFNIFCFLTFSFGYFLDLVFRAIFSKFGQNSGFVKYPTNVHYDLLGLLSKPKICL